MPTLFEYGIQVENSDIRAHVSVVNQTIYVFETKSGIEAIRQHDIEKKPAFQNGVRGKTAEGWPVPVELIEDLRHIWLPEWEGWEHADPAWNTTKKGRFAVRCVTDAMKAGVFPLWIDATETDRENVQVSGTDIVLFCRKRIQVKCDWRCGTKPAGTGNLFLQCAERNPLRRH